MKSQRGVKAKLSNQLSLLLHFNLSLTTGLRSVTNKQFENVGASSFL